MDSLDHATEARANLASADHLDAWQPGESPQDLDPRILKIAEVHAEERRDD